MKNSLHDGIVPFTISSQTFVHMNLVCLVCGTSPCWPGPNPSTPPNIHSCLGLPETKSWRHLELSIEFANLDTFLLPHHLHALVEKKALNNNNIQENVNLLRFSTKENSIPAPLVEYKLLIWTLLLKSRMKLIPIS
jgi:hypothetical protein